MEDMKQTNLTIRIDEQLRHAVAEKSKRTATNVSELLRNFLREWTNKKS